MIKICKLFFSTIRYTKSHEWIEILEKSKNLRIGITKFAQKQLGEVVYIDFIENKLKFEQGETMLTIQSSKVAADVKSPISGDFKQINKSLISDKDCSMINNSPQDIWLVELGYENTPTNLLDQDQYMELING